LDTIESRGLLRERFAGQTTVQDMAVRDASSRWRFWAVPVVVPNAGAAIVRSGHASNATREEVLDALEFPALIRLQRSGNVFRVVTVTPLGQRADLDPVPTTSSGEAVARIEQLLAARPVARSTHLASGDVTLQEVVGDSGAAGEILGRAQLVSQTETMGVPASTVALLFFDNETDFMGPSATVALVKSRLAAGLIEEQNEVGVTYSERGQQKYLHVDAIRLGSDAPSRTQ
jgi:hypothetical protein